MKFSEIKSIAFLHYIFPGGGAEMVTINLAKMLKTKGIKVYVFVYDLDETKIPEEASNIEIIRMSYPVDRRNIPDIINNIKEKDISLLVFPTDVYDVLLYADELRRKTDCKLLFILHSLPFWDYYESKEIKRYRTKGSILKQIEWYLLRSHKYTFGSKKRALKRVYRECYNKVDVFGTLCEEYARDVAKAIGVQYKNSKFRVLNNHIEINNQPVTPKQKEVCFIGRLSYWDKRPEHILRIWHLIEDRHPDWRLNILGTGPEREKLESLAKELKLNRVQFLGYVANPQQYYDRASIVCLTSNYEGWGMALMEAQSNQCAAIAFDCSAGVREILSPSWENGVLINSFNEKAYAEAMSRLMNDTELRDKVAKNGAVAVKRFSPENTLRQWECMLESLK